jgi:large subunit ribosomal protein L18
MHPRMNAFDRRKRRVRSALRIKSKARPRLSVFRSSKHIYAQLIDDGLGKTLAAASSLEKDMRSQLKTGADKAAAAVVGRRLAERALKIGIDRAVFDRGGYRYHGRIKALADGVREGGIKL